ncbi:1,4-alpha-glucan branching protein GlgB [Fulvivirgaceae bacterium PWU4]|uniref:1,4-alpha-glucan branching enzyme GlgB n=1 Tax=Chryseosolibacter histidini TaxID=2782349 RepID=A0AAP2DIA4_9BACT|nr:1,4-alpha-glucan branching protein GlgB [Chryseosolibacter histidini]MBT1696830.1 1,4-alpha-glucan branching protein GlgB [Chryseosolibacter histidini]
MAKKITNKEHETTTMESFSLITDYDIHLFKSGKHYKLYEKMGARMATHNGQEGAYFAVWAPNARTVSVIGNFNHWKRDQHVLHARWDQSGIWEGFFPDIKHGEAYKYAIDSNSGQQLEKSDPFATFCETPPKTASIIWQPKYEWKDQAWLEERKRQVGKPKPYSVYEVHFGSWRKKMDEGGRSLTYPEMAIELVNYVKDLGFTHVEFLPLMEHPFYGSWGYQLTGYYAPTSRYGSPEDFMYMVDCFHNAGIGVILDWVPSHFPGDAHGLFTFDGTYLYEHEDPRKGFHPDWKSYIFNYGRNEVRSFLISNAVYWLDKFHIDGLRVDAVASMLYLDYSRKAGEWIPNQYGGNENIEAITFLKEMNEVVYGQFPDAITIAEESTSWPGVSRPTYLGGLGFGQKWMMGWMHDTLSYFKHDSVHRKYHQNEITFSIMYAFTENFMLPLSHDEVVHGKGSLLGRMPGDEWKRFANLRLLFSYMFTHPGSKLVFMGGEFGQSAEWNHEKSLDWHLLQYDPHRGVQKLMQDLNRLYRTELALYQHAFDPKGFQWIDYGDRENSVIAYQRNGDAREDMLIVVCNFTPEVRYHYRIGVPYRGQWKEIFNSDDQQYFGSGVLNHGLLATSPVKYHGRDYSVSLTLPPLAMVVLRLEKEINEFELNDLGT